MGVRVQVGVRSDLETVIGSLLSILHVTRDRDTREEQWEH